MPWWWRPRSTPCWSWHPKDSPAGSDLDKALHLLSEFPIAGVVLNRAAETAPGYEYGYEAYGQEGLGATRTPIPTPLEMQ